MPYITKNTFNRIVKEIDLKQEPPPNKSRLEGRNLTILSKREMQRLAIITEILGSKDIKINRFLLKIKKPVDTFTYVNPERVPSYHIDKHCKALVKEYENYLIPSEIRSQGNKSVEKFRKFFIENKEEFLTKKMEFFYKTKKEFNLSRLPDEKDILEIRAPNSGGGEIDNFDLSSLEDDLDNSIREAEDFKNQSNFHRLIINKYGNKISAEKEVDSEKEKEILLKWRDLKMDIKKKYIIFTMVKNNPEIDLSGDFLDALGLNKCAFCSNKEIDVDFLGF